VQNLFLVNSIVEMHLALVAECDCTVFESKEGVILSHADVLAWEDVGTALADQNLPDLSKGTWGNLDAEILWIRISTVFSCSCGLFMCHNLLELAQ